MYPDRLRMARAHRDFNTDGYFFDYADGKRIFTGRNEVEHMGRKVMRDPRMELAAIAVHVRLEAEGRKFGHAWVTAYDREYARLCWR